MLPPNPPLPTGGSPSPNAANRNSVTVGIFGKHWTPGATKTRLAAGVGPDLAAAASRCFLETTMDRLRRLETSGERRLEFAPAGMGSQFAQLPGVAAGGWHLEPQAEGDLGLRMRTYFERALATARGAVLVGSDSPHLPVDEVLRACQWLGEAATRPRCVLGPTEDGGYWLIGASLSPPPVFDAMPWSDPGLLDATVARLNERGWHEGADYRLLGTWYDVDDLGDLTRLRRSLLPPGDDAELRHLAARLDELFGPLPPAPTR